MTRDHDGHAHSRYVMVTSSLLAISREERNIVPIILILCKIFPYSLLTPIKAEEKLCWHMFI